MKHKIGLCAICAVVLVFTVLMACSISSQKNYKFQRPKEKNEFSLVSSIEDATAIVNEYYADSRDYEALDYVANDSGQGFVNYAVVFYNREEANQANLLVNTNVGTGVLSLGGDVNTFTYSTEDGLTFLEPDVIALSFTECNEETLYDFEITCEKLNDENVHFKVKSDPR